MTDVCHTEKPRYCCTCTWELKCDPAKRSPRVWKCDVDRNGCCEDLHLIITTKHAETTLLAFDYDAVWKCVVDRNVLFWRLHLIITTKHAETPLLAFDYDAFFQAESRIQHHNRKLHKRFSTGSYRRLHRLIWEVTRKDSLYPQMHLWENQSHKNMWTHWCQIMLCMNPGDNQLRRLLSLRIMISFNSFAKHSSLSFFLQSASARSFVLLK